MVRAIRPIPDIMPARLLVWLLACAVLASSTAATAIRGPSTEEERQRVITITHKLEVTPLDQTLYQEREWAQQWLLDVPDVRILTCTGLLLDLRRPKYKYSTEMWAQLRLASAVFIDAFVLRTVLVPALMHLSGHANWWLPRWIDRWLPHLAVEPTEDAQPQPEPQPVSVG